MTFSRDAAIGILKNLHHELEAGTAPNREQPGNFPMLYAQRRWHAYWYARTLYRRAVDLEGLTEERRQWTGQRVEDGVFFPLNSLYRSREEAQAMLKGDEGVALPEPRTVASLDLHPLPLSPSQIPEDDLWDVLAPAILAVQEMMQDLLKVSDPVAQPAPSAE